LGDAFWTFLTKVLDQSPDWLVSVLTFGFALTLYFWIGGSYFLVRRAGKADKAMTSLLEFQRKYDDLNHAKEGLERSSALLEGMTTICSEIRTLVQMLLTDQDPMEQGNKVLQALTDRLSSGLKSRGREVHRCAIWQPRDEKHLEMVAGSSAFDVDFKNWVSLKIDGSVAGRCYRTKKASIDADATKNKDYQVIPEDPHTYLSLMCAPIVFEEDKACLGVLTVDGKEKGVFRDEDLQTVKAHAEMASIVMAAQSIWFIRQNTMKEVAAK
jgi:transcriptional regulator with GAF, ATPase, and Fis domain